MINSTFKRDYYKDGVYTHLENLVGKYGVIYSEISNTPRYTLVRIVRIDHGVLVYKETHAWSRENVLTGHGMMISHVGTQEEMEELYKTFNDKLRDVRNAVNALEKKLLNEVHEEFFSGSIRHKQIISLTAEQSRNIAMRVHSK